MILRRALRRAAAQHGTRFDQIVSVGDAVWDVQAAARLGWSFVGIATASGCGSIRAAEGSGSRARRRDLIA